MEQSATGTNTNRGEQRRAVPTRTHRPKHASAGDPARRARRPGARSRPGTQRTSATLTIVVSRVALVLGLAVILLAAQLKAPGNDRATQGGFAAPADRALSAAPGAGTPLLAQPSSVDGPAAPVSTPASGDSSSPAPTRGRSAGGVTSRPETSMSSAPQGVPSSPSVPYVPPVPSPGVDASPSVSASPSSPGRTSPAPGRSVTPPPPTPSRYYLTDRYFGGERAGACLAPADPRVGAQVVQRPCSGAASWTRTVDENGRLSLHYSDSLCLGLPDGAVQYASPLVLVPCGSSAEPHWSIDAAAHRVYVVSAPSYAWSRLCVTGYDDASERGTFDDMLFPCSRDALNQDVRLLPAQNSASLTLHGAAS